MLMKNNIKTKIIMNEFNNIIPNYSMLAYTRVLSHQSPADYILNAKQIP